MSAEPRDPFPGPDDPTGINLVYASDLAAPSRRYRRQEREDTQAGEWVEDE